MIRINAVIMACVWMILATALETEVGLIDGEKILIQHHLEGMMKKMVPMEDYGSGECRNSTCGGLKSVFIRARSDCVLLLFSLVNFLVQLVSIHACFSIRLASRFSDSCS
jgi:hypothetical protein